MTSIDFNLFDFNLFKILYHIAYLKLQAKSHPLPVKPGSELPGRKRLLKENNLKKEKMVISSILSFLAYLKTMGSR